jgi:hypothetical protein
MWNTGLVASIQSCLEFDGGGVAFEKLEKGCLPNINPFCIVDNTIAQNFVSSLKNNIKYKSINNGGLLIIDNSLFKE